MREQRTTMTISFPLSLAQLIMRRAIRNNVSRSLEVSKQMCKAYGLDPNLVIEGARKVKTPKSVNGAQELKCIDLPSPRNFIELYKSPHRPMVFYNTWLSVRDRWGVHDPGNQCPADCLGYSDDNNHPIVTEQDKHDVQELRDKYGIESI